MIYKCQVCKELKLFGKYTFIQYTYLENGIEYKKANMKVCKSCGDTLEEIKIMEGALKSGKDI